MTAVSHSSCLALNVTPARVVVEERLDETVACSNDDTIVSAAPQTQIVERGKLADGLIVEAVCNKYIEHHSDSVRRFLGDVRSTDGQEGRLRRPAPTT